MLKKLALSPLFPAALLSLGMSAVPAGSAAAQQLSLDQAQGPPRPIVERTQLSALGIPVLLGDQVHIAVYERDQGNTDLNGDGGTSDQVAFLVDLATGTEANLGVAITHSGVADDQQLVGRHLGFLAQEGANGIDWNGDSDQSDRALLLYDTEADALINVGLPAHQFVLTEQLVAFLVSEASHGDTDLNGDGDATDYVLHVFDLESHTTINLGLPLRLRADPIFSAAGDRVAGAANEANHGVTDLNGDGDTFDDVLFGFHLETGVTTNAGLALVLQSYGSGIQMTSEYLVAAIHEGAQGLSDLNLDGDPDDVVLFAFHLELGASQNMRLAVGSGDDFELGESLLAITVWETRQGATDLNGDGDAGDRVLHVYDFATDTLQNAGLALELSHFQRGGHVDGKQVAVLVRESGQDNRDLNGDGDMADSIVYVYDFETDTSRNLAVNTYKPHGSSSRRVHPTLNDGVVSMLAFEDSVDLNGDGSLNDWVFHFYDLATQTLVNPGIAALDFAQAAPTAAGRALLRAPEEENGADWNGNGTQEDTVVFFWERTAPNQVRNMAVNTPEGYTLPSLGSDYAVFLSSEYNAAPTDLNADGDLDDTVLFSVRWRP